MLQKRQSGFLQVILKINGMSLGILDVVLHPSFQKRFIPDQKIVFLLKSQLHPLGPPVLSFLAHLPRRMGSEGELIVVIRRRGLRCGLRRSLCRFVILPGSAEIDIADGQLDGDPLRAVLVVIRSDAQISGDSHKIALVEVLSTELSLSAPCGSPVEIGDVLTVRVLGIGIGRDREVGALGFANLRKDGIGRQAAYDGLLVNAHASLSSLNVS